jgi:predicted aspartyl protease
MRRATARQCLVAVAMLVAWWWHSHAEAAPCRFVKFATLPVDTQRGSPYIDGSVNGHPIKVLVDSGAAGTSLTRSIAERAELPLSHSGLVHVGVSGDSADYHARVKELTFGPVRWERVNLSVIWDLAKDMPFEALLGADFLFQNDIELLLAEKQIRFFRPEGCGKAHLAYWDANAAVVPMLPDVPDDRRAVIQVLVNGHPVKALIDTGATVSSIDQAAAAKAGVGRPAATAAPAAAASAGEVAIGIGKHEVPMWVGNFDEIDIGGEFIKNAKLRVMDMWGAARADTSNPRRAESMSEEAQMILGADFLASHRVLIAVSQRRVYLTHLGGRVFSVGER